MGSPIGNPYAGEVVNAPLLSPASGAQAVTKSDTTTYTGVRSLWIGGAGDVTVAFGATTVLFASVPAGSLLPIMPTKVMSAGTTATAMVVLF